MSVPHVILDNLPYLCQNCQITLKSDVVITKIILLVFFLRHGVHLIFDKKLVVNYLHLILSFDYLLYCHSY